MKILSQRGLQDYSCAPSNAASISKFDECLMDRMDAGANIATGSDGKATVGRPRNDSFDTSRGYAAPFRLPRNGKSD